jgi:NAD(P)-dependent dehydrogenase (short-subunit alcohol dehydrogenase family)
MALREPMRQTLSSTTTFAVEAEDRNEIQKMEKCLVQADLMTLIIFRLINSRLYHFPFCLINNASILLRSFQDTSLSIAENLNINLTAPFLLCQSFLNSQPNGLDF